MLDNAFVRNLQKKIEETVIYAPTGKYGKMEISYSQTRDAKNNLLLSATPKTLEDVVAYVQYLESLDALKNQKLNKKVSTILKYAEGSDKENILSVVREAMARNEKQLRRLKIKPYIQLAIVELVIILPFILWYFYDVINWEGIQSIWFVGALIAVVAISAFVVFLLRVIFDIIDFDEHWITISRTPF